VSMASEEKILVVDDELDTRIFLLNILNAGGFCPITADNQKEGLQKAAIEHPSVIILNMMMPGKGGIHLYQHLKQDKVLKQIPIVMLATLDKNTFLRCHNLYGYAQCEAYETIDQFMEQPVEAEDFLAMVRDLSTKGRA